MRFKNPYFLFNDMYSKDLQIGLCTFDKDTFNQMGLNYGSNLNKEDYFKKTPIWSDGDSDIEEITLNLLLYDGNSMKALVWTDEFIDQVYDWLITDDFCRFVSDDNPNVGYYFKVTSIKNMFTSDKKGYLECMFQPFSNFAYQYQETTLPSGKSKTINNISLYSYKPIVEITNLGDTSTVNKVNNFEIRGLVKGEKVIIDMEMLTVLNANGNNLLPNCNRKWISLQRGNNDITVSGNCNVVVKCDYPIYR